MRYPLGGFRCVDCGIAGADMEEMGFGSGYVAPLRTVFNREHKDITRSEW